MKRYIFSFFVLFLLGGFANIAPLKNKEIFFMNFAKDKLLPKTIQTNSFDPIVISPDKDGHFRINALVNGRNVNMLLDTGASMIALSKDEAERLGYNYGEQDFTHQGSTASGKVKFIEIKLKNIKIGNMVFNDIPAAIIDQPNVPALLGMSFISAFKKIEITENKLFITP